VTRSFSDFGVFRVAVNAVEAKAGAAMKVERIAIDANRSIGDPILVTQVKSDILNIYTLNNLSSI